MANKSRWIGGMLAAAMTLAACTSITVRKDDPKLSAVGTPEGTCSLEVGKLIDQHSYTERFHHIPQLNHVDLPQYHRSKFQEPGKTYGPRFSVARVEPIYIQCPDKETGYVLTDMMPPFMDANKQRQILDRLSPENLETYDCVVHALELDAASERGWEEGNPNDCVRGRKKYDDLQRARFEPN